MTPLHLAAESGHYKILNYHVDQGADINIQDNDGVVTSIALSILTLSLHYVLYTMLICLKGGLSDFKLQ